MKLVGSFVIAALFVLLVGLVGMVAADRLMANLDEMHDLRLPAVQALATLNRLQSSFLLAERSLLVKNDLAEVAFQRKRMDGFWLEADQALRVYDPLPHSKKEAALWSEFNSVWTDWKADYLQTVDLACRADPISHRQAMLLSYGKGRTAYLRADKLLKDILSLDNARVKDLSKRSDDELNETRAMNMGSMFLAIIISLVLGIFLSNSITKPLRKGVAFAEALEKGDLTARIDVQQKDEIGLLASALNGMSENLRSIVHDLVENSSTVNAAASELSSVSEQLAGNSRGLSEKSSIVAAATEEMSISIATVSAAAEQSASNANVVATATEEMTATVGEIAQSAEKARAVTAAAVSSVDSASTQMNELGSAAHAISKVIEVIVEIADQTKLLALNATIEAARAGEAGKGFAVVANEVKELAKQTNAATEEIRNKIEAMQQSTVNTISEIDGINRIIHSVEEIIASIATAVEEQSITTREIASNIGQAALGITSVTHSVNQSATVARGVASDVAGVSLASGEIKTASNNLSSSAMDLAKMGTSLKGIVNRFKI
jgi:methyl-accepting chemotaxis protein